MDRRMPLAAVACAMMLIIAIPLAASDADAAGTDFRDLPDYLDGDKRITISGYALFESEDVSVIPQIIAFIVVRDPVDGYRYVNVHPENRLLSGDVGFDDSNDYFFSIEVPLIDETKTNVFYGLCAYNNYSIWTVSSSFSDEGYSPVAVEPMSGSPASGGWDGIVIPEQNLFLLDRSAVAGADDGEVVQVTGDDGDRPADRITLKRATGLVKGHVTGTLSNRTNALADVLVSFSNDDGEVATARTDSDGDYTLNLPTGDYTVSFSRGNYVCDDKFVSVYDTGVAIVNADMFIELHNDYFGFDLSHFLMLVGGVVCVTIIAISAIYQYNRIRKGFRPTEWIVDDMDDDEKE